LLFTSCKKDDDDAPAAVTCKLAKSVYFNTQTGAKVDSAAYTYTGDKITKATSPQYYYTYEYSGDRVSKRNGFKTGQTTSEFYQQYTYNTDGTISKVEVLVPGGASGQVVDRTEFIYNAGKIQRIDYVDLSSGTAEKYLEATYTYTGNNITTVLFKDLSVSPAETLTLTYAYDSNNNFLKKQNNQIYLLDPLFIDFIDPTLLPLAISANNPTSIVVGATTLPVTYSQDDKQNLKDIKLSAKSLVEYGYQCQ
jgi:hypothetical protein